MTAVREILPAVLAAARVESTSSGSHIHGEPHWRRVATLGLDLAEADPRADVLLVTLFGVCHDSMRHNDGWDPFHGQRAASLVRELAKEATLRLEAPRVDLLASACADHAKGRTTANPTIGACWDADRLELCRLAIRPEPDRLSTEAAATPAMLIRARSLVGQPPEWEAVFERCERLIRTRPAGS